MGRVHGAQRSAESTVEAECEFLRSEIYRRSDAFIDARLLSAFDRYSARANG